MSIYIDHYGTLRELEAVPGTAGDVLSGVINGQDTETGEAWSMRYTLPREAVTSVVVGFDEGDDDWMDEVLDR